MNFAALVDSSFYFGERRGNPRRKKILENRRQGDREKSFTAKDKALARKARRRNQKAQPLGCRVVKTSEFSLVGWKHR